MSDQADPTTLHLLRLATRKSKLALAQARAYARSLEAKHQGLKVDELHVVTSGDKFQTQSLQALGGKGLFIKEVEEALLEGEADIAVHSIKDVPVDLAPGLRLASLPPREDPRDVLVSRGGESLADLPQGARVGTSSLRRRTLLLQTRPDLQVGPLRGNVDTRLRKLEEGQVDAIVLALAGLKRLGMQDRATMIFEPEMMLPAVGQGALGIECREDDERVATLLLATDDQPTRICVTAERAFMAAVEGSCHLPVAAFAMRDGEQLWLRTMLANDDGSNVRVAEDRIGWPSDVEDARRLGHELGLQLKAR